MAYTNAPKGMEGAHVGYCLNCFGLDDVMVTRKTYTKMLCSDCYLSSQGY